MTPLLAAQGEPMDGVTVLEPPIGGETREQSPTPGWSMSRNAQTQILHINDRIEQCLSVIGQRMVEDTASLPAAQRSLALASIRRGKRFVTSTLVAAALARWADDIEAKRTTERDRLDRYFLEYLLVTTIRPGRQTEAYLNDESWTHFSTVVNHLAAVKPPVPQLKSRGHERQGNGRLVVILALVKYADEIRPLSDFPHLFRDE